MFETVLSETVFGAFPRKGGSYERVSSSNILFLLHNARAENPTEIAVFGANRGTNFFATIPVIVHIFCENHNCHLLGTCPDSLETGYRSKRRSLSSAAFLALESLKGHPSKRSSALPSLNRADDVPQRALTCSVSTLNERQN